MNPPIEHSGIQDWQDKEAYPKCYEDLTEWNWRWEFLRRDPTYQKAWNRGSDLKMENWPYRMPHREDIEICGKLFRLEFLVDPWGDRELAAETNMYGDNGSLTLDPPYKKLGQKSHEVVVSFDINRPLKSQIDHAYQVLKEKQTDRKQELIVFRKHKNKWPLYLRLLDALAQGDPSKKEIYDHLLKEVELLDAEKYDSMCVANPTTLISDWQDAANKTRNDVIRYL